MSAYVYFSFSNKIKSFSIKTAIDKCTSKLNKLRKFCDMYLKYPIICVYYHKILFFLIFHLKYLRLAFMYKHILLITLIQTKFAREIM